MISCKPLDFLGIKDLKKIRPKKILKAKPKEIEEKMVNTELLRAANKQYPIYELEILQDYFLNKNEYIF